MKIGGEQAWDRVKQAIVAHAVRLVNGFSLVLSGQRARGQGRRRGKSRRETEQERRRIRAEHVSRMDEAERSLTNCARGAGRYS